MYQAKEHVAIIQELLLAKSLLDWRTKPQMSFRRIIRNNCEQDFIKNQNFDSREILEQSIFATLSNLTRQIFMLNYEYLRHNIDDKMTNQLKSLKNATSVNSNNINTARFMDVIRQSFAHNDISKEVPNWKLTDDDNIEINFKGNKFIFTLMQLQQILNEFLSLKKEHFYYTFHVEHRDLINLVNKGKLTPQKVEMLFNIINQDETPKHLDKYQSKSIYNILTSKTDLAPNEHLNLFISNDYYMLQKFLPHKHNAGNISYLNNMIFRCLFYLNKNYDYRENFIDNALNFESNINLIDNLENTNSRTLLLEYINYDSLVLEHYIISNALFTLFSVSQSNNLEKYFNDININSLRNSLMHGRYFYNGVDGFEFYDGINNKNLTHIASLNVNQILTAISNFMSDNYNNSSNYTH